MTPHLPTFDRVEAYRVRIPFTRPFETARGLIATRKSWILRLRDVDGSEGFGEVALDPAASPTDEDRLGAAVTALVAALAAGRTANFEIVQAGCPAGRALQAGLDGAVDALRRAAFDCEAGPGGRPSTLVNATLGIGGADQTAAAAIRAVGEGFRCVKLKAGDEAPAVIVDRVRAVRRAIGPSISLRLDANCSWSQSAGIETLDALAGFDLEYVEQPLAAGDIEGHASLRRIGAVPIALDESVDSETAAAAILAARAADVLVVKPARVGGPRAVRAIAALAALDGVPVVLSTFFETGVGTDAAVRAAAGLPVVGPERAHGLATAAMLEHDLLRSPAAIIGGRITVPGRLAVDEEALRRYTVQIVAADL